ncbi:MAG TPA: DUF2378 family protein [Polyangiaceae bacterium]
MASEEVIVPFREDVVPLRAGRSTLLVSAQSVFRVDGTFERYAANLPDDTRDAVLHMVVGDWLPTEVLLAHYRACDALGLSQRQAAEYGRTVLGKTRETWMGTMALVAREAGATPWTLIEQFQRFWDRAYQGGAIRVVKTGPKDARCEVVEVPLCDVAYYRHATLGLIAATLELFTRKAYVSQVPFRSPGAMTFRMQWA